MVTWLHGSMVRGLRGDAKAADRLDCRFWYSYKKDALYRFGCTTTFSAGRLPICTR